jgi:hypothetical protein
MKPDRQRRAWPAALVTMLVLSVVSSPSLGAQAGSNTVSPSANSASNNIVASLEYLEVPNPITTWGISVQPQTAPFAKEPALAGRNVKRGRLDFRPGRGQALAFIWDSTPGKFYLDINGNGDLTDDTNGVFSSQTKTPDGRYQQFKDVRLTFQMDKGPYPLLLDLNLNNYSRLYVSASLRSLYAGKIALAGREWQIGLIEKPYSEPGLLRDAALLLRPWETRGQAFSTEDGSLQTLALPTSLFLDGHAYQVECAWDSLALPRHCRITMTEQVVPLGELRVAGKFIQRALLLDGSRTVVLDSPNELVQVPLGNYTSFDVHLQKDAGSASLKRDFLNRGVKKTITVQAGQPGLLTAGGPLTNSVTLNRRGSLLVLNHQVAGAGGEAYQLDGATDPQHPPTFAIYRGDKQLASGKFQFG